MASAEPCTSALMTSGSSETFLSVSLAIMSASEAPCGRRAGLLALHADAVGGELAGAGLVLDHGEGLAGIGRAVEAEDLHRHRRTGFGDLLVALVEQRADPAPVVAGHDDVAALQGAALDQHGGDGAAAAVELGLDHHAVGGAVGVGLQVEDLGLQQDGFDQVVEAGLLLGGDLDRLGVAAQAFDDDLVLQQLVDHPGRIGAGLVDLVDRHDDRRAGRLGVIDGLDGLGHHAVVGRHHQDHDVGDVAPRIRMAEKAAWPGVSRKVTRWPSARRT